MPPRQHSLQTLRVRHAAFPDHINRPVSEKRGDKRRKMKSFDPSAANEKRNPVRWLQRIAAGSLSLWLSDSLGAKGPQTQGGQSLKNVSVHRELPG